MAKMTQDELDANESRNIRVVGDFQDYWWDRKVDLRQQSMGLMFRAQVNYQSPVRDAVEQTDVRISLSGFGTDGSIEIYESGDLTTEKYHLGMQASYGTYSVNPNSGALSVSNSSTKMGGKYTVEILPLV